MIKGVNKVIIEVNDTENEVFEKAILYVRPEFSGKKQSKLQNHAKAYINTATLNNDRFQFDFEESGKRHRRLFLILAGYLLLLGTVIYFIFS